MQAAGCAYGFPSELDRPGFTNLAKRARYYALYSEPYRVSHSELLLSIPQSRARAQLPVIDVQFAHLDGLGKLQQVVRALFQMRRTAPVAVRRLHRLLGLPVRDGGELRDVVLYLPELLHAETARLLLDLENAVLVVVAEVLVRELLAGPPEPGPRDKRLPTRPGRQDLLLSGGVGTPDSSPSPRVANTVAAMLRSAYSQVQRTFLMPCISRIDQRPQWNTGNSPPSC